MNISRSEAKFKCAIFWWAMAAVIGLTVAVIGKLIGLWALGALIGGAGTGIVAGIVLTTSFCKTDAELADDVKQRRAIAAARAPYKQANDAKDIKAAERPGGPKVAPTVARSAPKPAPKPAPAPAAKAAPAPTAKAAPAPKPAPAPAPKPAPAPEPAAASSDVGKRPEALSKARAGGADDLKKIKGVGPKLEKLLNELGFYHYDQIATWTDEEVAWVDENLEGFKGRVSRDEWVAQATILAEGGETEFSKKVDKGDVY